MIGKGTVTLKELHARTGELVRAAGRSRIPVQVTDRGKVVAVIGGVDLKNSKPRRRKLLPEYAGLLQEKVSKFTVLADLDAVRGDL